LYVSLRPAYDEALREIHRAVRELLEQHGFAPTIKYRVKRFSEYFDKLRRNARKRKGPFAVTDLLGLRIICPFLEDVEQVKKLLTDRFEVVETERKAADHNFREFGYDSVHLLIKLDRFELETPLPQSRRVCEIQVRTILQEAWAEVEHELVYKSRLSLPNESIRRKLAALNATLTLSDLTFQEIRDYQKALLDLDHKRRSALDGILHLPGLEWPPAAVEPPGESEVPPPVLYSNPLEKAMLEALAAHSRHQFERAVELYSRIHDQRMSRTLRALIYNHRGMALFSLGRTAEAFRDFSRAIKYDGENLRAFCNRGLVHRVLKRLGPSLEDYDRALALNPALAEAFLGRAQTYLDLRYPDRALADCEKALQIHPESAAAQGLLEKIRRDFFRT
jgi:putative GTP pyrophosphokinase